jgi:hypothetical protein
MVGLVYAPFSCKSSLGGSDHDICRLLVAVPLFLVALTALSIYPRIEYDVFWQASRSYLKLMLCTCSNESFILSFITFLDLDSTTELFDSPSLSI